MQQLTPKINFENIEQKLTDAITSPAYAKLVEKVTKAKKIFILGNGGLHFVASHGATDMTRLIPEKVFYSFESVGFITSNANDYGYDNLFQRWLETVALGVENPDDVLLIGASCSGNSMNVINALHWGGGEQGYATFMISGKKSKKLAAEVDELILNCEYFHTVEVLTLMVFYDIIHQTGNHCPTIEKEIIRKGQ